MDRIAISISRVSVLTRDNNVNELIPMSVISLVSHDP